MEHIPLWTIHVNGLLSRVLDCCASSSFSATTTIMKLSPPVLLSLLVAGRASATPIGDFNGLQSILTGIVDHADDLSRLLQTTTKDILNFVDGSRDAAIKDSKKILTDVEKDLESWIENGREFITQHGTTCEWHAMTDRAGTHGMYSRAVDPSILQGLSNATHRAEAM
jgi:hypothetical protein